MGKYKNRILARAIISLILQPIPYVGGAIDSFISLIQLLLPKQKIDKITLLQFDEALCRAIDITMEQCDTSDTKRRLLIELESRQERLSTLNEGDLFRELSRSGEGICATSADYRKLGEMILDNLYKLTFEYPELHQVLVWNIVGALQAEVKAISMLANDDSKRLSAIEFELIPEIDLNIYLSKLSEHIEGIPECFDKAGKYYDGLVRTFACPATQTWKAKLLSTIQVLLSESPTPEIRTIISETIENISNNHPYDYIKQIVQKLVEQLGYRSIPCSSPKNSYESNLEELFYAVEKSYDKVVVISGEPGSGKTQFVKEYIDYYYSLCMSQNRLSSIRFCIPLEWSLLTQGWQINDLIVDSVNRFCKATKRFNDMQAIEDYLACIDSQICFVVDDLQNLYYGSDLGLSKFLEIITVYTQYEHIDWLMSLNEFDMHILLKRYKFGFSVMDYAVSIQANTKFAMISRLTKCTLYSFDFNLTQYHKDNRTYVDILKLYKKEDEVNLDELLKIEEARLSKIFNPKMCHIVSVFCEHFSDILSIVSEVYYDDFLLGFCNFINSSLNRQAQLAVPSWSILALSQKKILFSSEEIVGLSESVLQLKLGNLIKIIPMMEMELPLTRHRTEIELEHYELYLHLFWSYRIFRQIIIPLIEQECIICRSSPIAEESRLLICLNAIVEYREMFIQYFILYCDKDEGKLTLLYQYIQCLLANNSIAPALNSIRYLTTKTQSIIVKSISNCMVSVNNLNATSVYAILKYVERAVSEQFVKFNLLRILINRIEELEFEDIFESTFEVITSSITDFNEVIALIEIMFDSDAVTLNKSMGITLSQKYLRLHSAKRIESIFELFDRDVVRTFSDDSKRKIINTIGDNSLYNWLVRGLIYNSLSYSGTQSYRLSLLELFDYLDSNNFFFYKRDNLGKKVTKRKKIQDFYRRNFANAAGDVFSNKMCDDVYQENYYAIVERLIERAIDVQDYTSGYRCLFAFYLITNSLRDNINSEEKLDERLFLSLKRIINSGKIREHLEIDAFNRFISYQLSIHEIYN